jgi:hypothetical protein
MGANVEAFEVFAGSAKGLQARPLNADGSIATSENIASIAYASFDESNGEKVAFGELDVADVMHSSPQSWDVDEDGCTFHWPAPGSLWPAADKRYRVQITFTPVGGELPYMLAWQAMTKKVFA